MKQFITSLFILFLSFSIFAQSYTINHFQSNYDTLVEYNSLPLEFISSGEDPLYWENDFDFGFEFPFYGSMYNQIFMDSDAIGYFPGSDNYNIAMFTSTYTIGNISSLTYLDSDIRYSNTTINGLKALIIEFHNVYNDDEYLDLEDGPNPNHYLNFQMQFFENGIIELHLGDIDLDSCSYYFPGQGFSSDNEDPEDNIYGPWIEISNDDFSESASFSGDYNNPTILYDDYDNSGVLTSIPPEGYVVQFIPNGITSTEELIVEEKKNYNLIQENGIIEIVGDLSQYKSCNIYDLAGKEIIQTTNNHIPINHINPQIILVVVNSESGNEVHKLLIE